MNLITLFYRTTSDEYAAPCDIASIQVVDAIGNSAGYIGASWGEHVPENVLKYEICLPEQVDEILKKWKLKRKEENHKFL